jgi:hypothetical protein
VTILSGLPLWKIHPVTPFSVLNLGYGTLKMKWFEERVPLIKKVKIAAKFARI